MIEDFVPFLFLYSEPLFFERIGMSKVDVLWTLITSGSELFLVDINYIYVLIQLFSMLVAYDGPE